MARRPVLTKTDFVRRYLAGEFGNRAPTWDTLEQCLRSGYKGLIHIRNRVKGAKTWYNVPHDRLKQAWLEAIQCFPPEKLYLSAMAPTEKTVIQGEVQRGLWYLDLTYTTVRKPMREALAQECRTAKGLTAIRLLKTYLCPNSYEWLWYLLDEYEDHVVEFSTYSVCWGTVPGYNTVFWEVRKY